VIVLIISFYWLRVATAALLLVAWGGLAFVLPLYVVAKSLNEGSIFGVVIAPLVAAPTAYLWFMTAKSARRWYEREERLSTFWKPWNAR